MPAYREGWTLLQSLDLRVGAIEYLRVLNRRSSQVAFLEGFWTFWRTAHGVYDPQNWDEVNSYEEYISDYRRVSV